MFKKELGKKLRKSDKNVNNKFKYWQYNILHFG